MAFSQSDLDAIESAIATGELTVEIDGKRVTYRSMDDLIKARSMISNSLQASGTIPKKTRVTYAARSRN